MRFDRKAFYNSLYYSNLEDSLSELEAWQIQDYRRLTNLELFARVQAFDIALDASTFPIYAENLDSPEELLELITEPDDEEDIVDQIYLLLFELWRRIVPEKPSLSIFCDEVDYQIALCDKGLVKDEDIQDILSYLEEILNENVDAGGDPKEVFKVVSSGCAHSLENFLYDFIAMQIDDDNISYANDLLDGYNDFLELPVWFDFLRIRLLALSDPNDAHEALEALLKTLKDSEDSELFLEILNFAVYHGDYELFYRVVLKTLSLLEEDEDLEDLLLICMEYFKHCDLEEQVQQTQQFINQRRETPLGDYIKRIKQDKEAILQLVESSRQYFSET